MLHKRALKPSPEYDCWYEKQNATHIVDESYFTGRYEKITRTYDSAMNKIFGRNNSKNTYTWLVHDISLFTVHPVLVDRFLSYPILLCITFMLCYDYVVHLS